MANFAYSEFAIMLDPLTLELSQLPMVDNWPALSMHTYQVVVQYYV